MKCINYLFMSISQINIGIKLNLQSGVRGSSITEGLNESVTPIIVVTVAELTQETAFLFIIGRHTGRFELQLRGSGNKHSFAL